MEDKICGAYPAVLFSFFALASLLLLLLLLHSVRDRFLRVHDPVYISLSHRLTLFCSLNYPVVSHFLSCPSLPLLSLSLVYWFVCSIDPSFALFFSLCFVCLVRCISQRYRYRFWCLEGKKPGGESNWKKCSFFLVWLRWMTWIGLDSIGLYSSRWIP